jgi:GT2 family glycosyltransferase
VQVEQLPQYQGVAFSLASNMGCRREVFDDVGWFDGDFTYGADDVEFFFRAHVAGVDAAFVPSAVVARRERGTLGGFARQWYRYTIARAQVDAKFRRTGDLPKQTARDRVDTAWVHLRALMAVRLLLAPSGRWRYAQRLAKAGGSVVGFLRYHEVAV